MRRERQVRPADAGLTLLELIVVLWIAAILLAITIPNLLGGLDEYRTRAAARYVSGQFFKARMEAVKRSAPVACRFRPEGDDYSFATFKDGNANGVRTTEIARGVDPRLTDDVRLSALFGGVRFGIADGVPLIDGGYATDPIRVAGNTLVTFGPDGTSSTGSVYIRGARATQYAVRVFGVTGRTRVFRFSPGSRTWRPI